MKRIILLIAFCLATPLLAQDDFNGYEPPDCNGVFFDVACPSQYANWVERLYAERVTVGCGHGDFCPDSYIDRSQMAVWEIKMEHRILARFAAGQAFCLNDPTVRCSMTIKDPGVHADTISIQCTYLDAQTADIPCVVNAIREGEFDVTIKNNRHFSWLAFTNTEE